MCDDGGLQRECKGASGRGREAGSGARHFEGAQCRGRGYLPDYVDLRETPQVCFPVQPVLPVWLLPAPAEV